MQNCRTPKCCDDFNAHFISLNFHFSYFHFEYFFALMHNRFKKHTKYIKYTQSSSRCNLRRAHTIVFAAFNFRRMHKKEISFTIYDADKEKGQDIETQSERLMVHSRVFFGSCGKRKKVHGGRTLEVHSSYAMNLKYILCSTLTTREY